VGEPLGAVAAVDEHEPFLTAVQPRHDGGRVVEAPDVVDHHVGMPDEASRRVDDVAPAAFTGCQPREQGVRVADRGGEPDALQRAPREVFEPCQYGEQVPAAVVTREGVDLVDDRRPQVAEEDADVDAGGDEDRLKRLRRGEQHVRWLGDKPAPCRVPDVAVPQADPVAGEAHIPLQAGQEVVQQRPERTQIERAERLPALGGDAAQHREGGGLGLAPRCGREQKGVIAVEDRPDGSVLQRP
jgi:hypothetical protein